MNNICIRCHRYVSGTNNAGLCRQCGTNNDTSRVINKSRNHGLKTSIEVQDKIINKVKD